MDLQKRCIQVLGNWFKDENQVQSQWNEIKKEYSSPSRYYHNLSHLKEIFNAYDLYIDKLEYPLEVAYAIFYHDIVYNSMSKKNELQSAELAKDYLLAAQVDDKIVARVFNLIMVTKDHNPKTKNDEKWMIDF